MPLYESGFSSRFALAGADISAASELCASKVPALDNVVFSSSRASAGLKAAGRAISHVPTPGALVREWSGADQAACDSVARATNMGAFIPGGQAWVLEAPKKGIVGYTSMFNHCWADIAVLPKYRGDTPLLADTALTAMREQGGSWFTNAKESTGYPFMKRLESRGAIKISRESSWGFMRDPYHSVDFTVL
jgi:hypothetical protein